MIVMSTPVYESVRVAALDGIPAATGYPPHHPDIYRQLCAEFGHDPRTGERLASRQWQALRFPASGTLGPPHPVHEASVGPGDRRRAGAHALPWRQGAFSAAEPGIDDKHKLLIPVDMFLGTVNLHYGFRDMQMPPFDLRPADVIRLQEGAEVLHIAEAARFTEQGDFTNKYSFTFDLALDSPALLGPRPVHAVPTAQALIDHAEAVAVALLDRFG